MLVRARYQQGVFVPLDLVSGINPLENVLLQISSIPFTPHRRPDVLNSDEGRSAPFDLPLGPSRPVEPARIGKRQPGVGFPTDEQVVASQDCS